MKFADKMKLYRRQKGWTQQDVAERLLISRKTISSWENGRSYPDIFMLVQISDLYHVSLDDLLREDHEMINNYKEEHTINKRVDKIFVICYFLNIIGAIVTMLKPILPFRSHYSLKPVFTIISFIIVSSLIILVSYADWFKIKNKLGFWVTWLIITLLEIRLTFPVNVPINDNGIGYICGTLIGNVLVALCLTCTVWLFPQFKERRAK